MTIEEIRQVWNDQGVPAEKLQVLSTTTRREQTRSAFGFYFSIVSTALCLLLGIFNFYGQHVVNGDRLLVALLRALPVFAAVVIQVFVYRSLRRTHREREQLLDNHRAWLMHRTMELEKEARGEGRWMLILFFVFVVVVVAWTKWFDYFDGQDSFVECVVMILIVVAIFGVAFVAKWHHRRQFVVPKLSRYQALLNELEGEEWNGEEVKGG